MISIWPISTIGNEFDVQLGKMLDAARDLGEPKVYIGNRAVQWGRIDISNAGVVPLTRNDRRRYRLRRGDLLVCEGGEVGRGAIWRDELHECYYQKALHRLRPKHGYNVQLMLALLEYWSSTGGFADYVTQTSIAHLPREKLVQIPLPVPSASEQERLGDVLQDVTALAATLDDLITKKKAMKQGMMQRLLSGRSRLPGFSRPWKSCRLSDLLTYEQPGRHLVRSTEYGDVGTPVLTAGKTFILGYTTEQHGIYSALPVIIFDDFTTATKFVNFQFKAKSSAMKILSARPGVSLRYIYECMQLIDFPTIDHKRRWITEYSKLEVEVPDEDEQTAVAAVLDNAENEIAALQERLRKARSIKQGMLQQLLTGRTRLS